MKNNTSVSKQDRLENENIFKLLLSFSLTTLASLVFNTLYSLTDALFVSHAVGDNAFGGVSIIFPFTIFQSAVATAVGGGAGSIVSRKLGEKDPKGAGEATLNAMFTFYVTAILTTILGFVFMDEMLQLFGVTEELLPFAKTYFSVILAGNIFSTGFSSIIRAEGKMKYSLLIWVIPIAVNIILDALFILVFDWGVLGSAAATVACQFVSFSMSMLFFSKFTTQEIKGAKISLKKIGEVIVIGLPALIQTMSLSVMAIIINRVIKSVSGTPGINAYSYANKVITYIVMPITAFSQALSPIAGYNYGAKNYGRVKESVRSAIVLSLAYAAIAFALVEIFPEALLKIFTTSEDTVALASSCLTVLAIGVFVQPVSNVLGVTLQTLGKKYSATIVFVATIAFVIPLSLILSNFFGLSGVWYSTVIANLLSAILAVFVWLYVRRKLV